MVAAFSIGVGFGPIGLAWAWLVAYPLYLAISLSRSLPVIGVRFGALAHAVAPVALAAIGMALAVTLVDRALPAMAAAARLGLLVVAGGTVYAGWLAIFARSLVAETVALLKGR